MPVHTQHIMAWQRAFGFFPDGRTVVWDACRLIITASSIFISYGIRLSSLF